MTNASLISKIEPATRIAVFGFKDSFVGQVFEFLKNLSNYQIEYFISLYDLPSLNVEHEHSKRPNRKTEFVVEEKIFGKPVYVDKDYVNRLQNDDINSVLILEDDRNIRSEIFKQIKKTNIKILSFIHPSVFFGGFNTLGEGVIIFPNCHIGYKSDIGDGTILQSNCLIEHHNSIGSFTDINPNLTTGGFTKIGDFVEINISVVIINRINVNSRSRIGAGSLVLNDCDACTLYYGSPAKAIRRLCD